MKTLKLRNADTLTSKSYFSVSAFQCFSVCFLLLCAPLIASAQTTRRVPVQMVNGAFVVDVPVIVQTNIVNNTTNIVSKPAPLMRLSSNVIDATIGTRLIRFVNSPSEFSTSNFADGIYTTFYWVNPGKFRLTFPDNWVWLNGVAPTNQPRGALLLESVNGEIWATQ